MSVEQDGVEYREIPGLIGYRFGSDGTVWSKFKSMGQGIGNRPVGKWKLKRAHVESGYLRLCLCRNGVSEHQFVHRLILLAFVGPQGPGQEACHNNGNKLDNRISNLRWDTKAANMADIVKHGRRLSGDVCPSTKISSDKVRELIEECREFSMKEYGRLAEKFGVHIDTARKIVKGQRRAAA